MNLIISFYIVKIIDNNKRKFERKILRLIIFEQHKYLTNIPTDENLHAHNIIKPEKETIERYVYRFEHIRGPHALLYCNLTKFVYYE